MTTYVAPLEIPRLKAALRDAQSGSEEARWVAAIALGRARGPQQLEALEALGRLLDDPFEEVRAQALEGIAEQCRGGARVSVDAVKRALNDPSPCVRCAAIDTATILFEDPKEDAAFLLEDTDPSVRAAAASALGDLYAVSKADQVAGLLDDSDEFVIQRAAIALSALEDPRCELILLDLLERSADTACEAAFALGRLGKKTSAMSLQRVAEQRFAPIELKATAAAAMVCCGASEGREILTRLLKARRQSTRLTVLGVLARLPIKGMIQAVGRLFKSGRSIEISAAIQTLGALGEIDTEAALEELGNAIGICNEDFEEEIKETLSSLKAY